MKGAGVVLFVMLGFLLLLIAWCAGAAAVAPADPNNTDRFLPAAAGVVGVAVFSAAVYCFWQAIREAFGQTTPKQTVPVSVSGFRCPRCESTIIIRLPTNEVSSLRAYRCEECGVGLTTPGAKLTFLAVGLVAGGVLAVAAYQLITTEGRWGLGFGLVTVAVVVFGYCFRQLCQPSARPV